MLSRLLSWLRSPAWHPRLAVLSLVLLVLVGYLAWRGGCLLWARWDRARAEEALAEYDFAEARRRLDRCIRLRPDDPQLRLLAARTARRDGDLAAAEQQLRAHRNLVGDASPEGTLELALLTAQRGDVREVVNYLMECLDERHPQSEPILEALAMGCVQDYQLARAMFWTAELLEKWPENAIGRLIRAQTVDTQGNRPKALAQLQELVRGYPKFYRARTSLADMLFKSRRYRESAAEYAVQLQQRPDDEAALLGLASAYERMGETEKARPLMQQLRQRYPGNSEVLLECGRFALGEKDPAEAEALLRRAVELAPNDHEVHRELGVCLEQLGKHEEAEQHSERCRQIEADLIQLEKAMEAMAKAPNDPAPRRKAGEICLRNGQIAEGLRWLLGVLDMDPNDRATRRILADFYAARGDTERANFYAGKGR